MNAEIRCRFCKRTVADIGGDAHAIIASRGWPGEYQCRNILDCTRVQKLQENGK